VIVYVEVSKGATVFVPEVEIAPDQAPDGAHDVAFVDDQVKVLEEPDETLAGDAERLAVGGGCGRTEHDAKVYVPDSVPLLQVRVSLVQICPKGTAADCYAVTEPPSGIVDPSNKQPLGLRSPALPGPSPDPRSPVSLGPSLDPRSSVTPGPLLEPRSSVTPGPSVFEPRQPERNKKTRPTDTKVLANIVTALLSFAAGDRPDLARQSPPLGPIQFQERGRPHLRCGPVVDWDGSGSLYPGGIQTAGQVTMLLRADRENPPSALAAVSGARRCSR
jgi:hypothetical protein